MLNFQTLFQSGSGCSSALITRTLAQLTLADLNCYVSAWAMRQWLADSKFQLADHAFSLHDALHKRGPDRWKGKSSDVVGYCTLYETNEISVCWFVLPPGAVLPLHDHCMMRVFQRVLFGKLRVTSFDWLDSSVSAVERAKQPCGGEAIVVSLESIDATSNACDPSSLVTSFGPNSGGVLHEIVNDGRDPALFIDVITPPYNTEPYNIKCTYFLITRKDKKDLPLPKITYKSAVCEGLEVGQRVFLTPRLKYDGPPMNAFVPLQ